jgi:hypothetical protein
MAEYGRSSALRSSTLWCVHSFPRPVWPDRVRSPRRGGEAPENTLEAFQIAVTLGYTYIETDAHVTRDGVLVAFHDERLDRVTDRTGAIADLGIVEVEAADAGYTFSLDGGEQLPVSWSRHPCPAA